jgi:Fe-S-cluster containining protein
MNLETPGPNGKLTKRINGLLIDPKIFTFKFGCNCTGECCHYGVYTDLKEHDRILSMKDKLISLFDDSQTTETEKWFETPETDDDFESGIVVGTEINNNKCTFLDKNGLCVLQKLALMQSEHKWKYKPIFCVLFPLTIFEGTLTIDDEHIERLKTCNNNNANGQSIFQACKEELNYFFGDDGFAELLKYESEYLKKENMRIEENVTK